MASSASRYCLLALVSLILLSSSVESSSSSSSSSSSIRDESIRGNQILDRACDEVYIVGEGETLHMISDKCGDPFIVEQNPHIHDPDDVFPGLVIKITPFKSRKLLS